LTAVISKAVRMKSNLILSLWTTLIFHQETQLKVGAKNLRIRIKGFLITRLAKILTDRTHPSLDKMNLSYLMYLKEFLVHPLRPRPMWKPSLKKGFLLGATWWCQTLNKMEKILRTRRTFLEDKKAMVHQPRMKTTLRNLLVFSANKWYEKKSAFLLSF
jgi:hypothetical protein